MFRALSAHLQEDTIIYMQHMVLSHFVVYTYTHIPGPEPAVGGLGLRNGRVVPESLRYPNVDRGAA